MASKLLVDGDGKFVMWSYIDKLEKLQNANGVRIANRINSKHINFDGQKVGRTNIKFKCCCFFEIFTKLRYLIPNLKTVKLP